MLFTTYLYFAFLLVAVLIHWRLPTPVARSVWLVVCSILFYTVTQGAYVALLGAYVVFNWWVGLRLAGKDRPARLLWWALAANLTPLLYYKYLPVVGGSVPAAVPLGISFFAFQASAYLVDVYRGGAPLGSLLDFSVFKMFWAQLVAGPILRASELRDQLRIREWDGAASAAACGRILNGLTKKVVLADSLAPIVDQAFRSDSPVFLDATVGTLAFGLQIYFDFSGYSDIAIGSARLLGFRFPENFSWPYASLSPQEFWQRWHMTLSRWIRDYVFTPLSIHFRRDPLLGRGSIVVAMVLCGAWHGAGFTFLLWGLWHGILLLMAATPPFRQFYMETAARGGTVRRFVAFITTLGLVQIGWIFFRADTVHQVGQFLLAIGTIRGGFRPAAVRETGILVVGLVWIGLLAVQVLRPRLARLQCSTVVRLMAPAIRACQAALVVIMHQNATAFVYFQF